MPPHRWHACDARVPLTLLLFTASALWACEPVSRPGDTSGVQTLGRWEWHGRLVVEPDAHVTLVRMRIDTGGPGPGADVLLARYDFNPTAAEGDEYALAVGLELGHVRDLRPGVGYPIGAPPAPIAASATVTCLCRPLKLDSLPGTFLLATRALRQLTGRLDATMYFAEWNDPSRHVTYYLHQRIDAIK